MKDLSIDDLLDDINTDAMTPAWVCFSHKPEDIARCVRRADRRRQTTLRARRLINGNFEVIVSGYRKGVGSSRETATVRSGAASASPWRRRSLITPATTSTRVS
jgi:3-isopropylmalate/(R)-2-methylmalate dehydratase large subunit